jgi:leucyl-tRNA synthetase
VARKKRAEGFNVLYPIGWDAFGLPTENYAVKTKTHPRIVTQKNTDNFRRQLKSLGFSFDWSREINTTDPKYYKWTQWIFTKLFEGGLAYKAKMPINWCLSCRIGLANEEVVDGRCERCGGETEKREKEQWMLAITKYADRLLDDLDTVDYWERIKTQQKNWIGKSEGVEIDFAVKDLNQAITVFTTRADTIFGATYIVLAPEYPLKKMLERQIENKDEILQYIGVSTKKSEIERMAEGKEKTGIELKGVKAINPANGEEIPIFIADYVLAHYGTGAIMAVPAHDARDFAFAETYSLPVVEVIKPNESKKRDEVYTGTGTLVNSGEFNGLSSQEAMEKIAKKVGGRRVTTYKLRDWIFSRQRYWGEPIPMVYCRKCGWVSLPASELPLELPEIEDFEPSESGESPLSKATEWINTECPTCGGPATRETDTMPNWAGSSWYYLRYTDPENSEALASKERLSHWMPVDWYNGGMEHTTLHLLYSRFWHKFLYDVGVVTTIEPYQKRTSHGLILAEDGNKMSKSKGNVINPDDVVGQVGADTLRVYEMFTGPFDQSFAWSTDNMVGSRRFLERVWRLSERVLDEEPPDELARLLNQTIKKVGEDIEGLKLNTAVSQLMILTGELERWGVPRTAYRALVKLLSPFAPHITEEIWQDVLREHSSVHDEPWPAYREDLLLSSSVTIALQVNGKVRGQMSVVRSMAEEEITRMAQEVPAMKRHLENKAIQRVVYVPERLLNFVVES